MSEVVLSDACDEALRRFAAIRITPEEAAQRDAERIRKDADMEHYAMDSHMNESNAPKRHRNASELKQEGPWGETLAKVKGKIGTGCLIALYGTRGAGKTQLAVEVMKHAAKKSILYSTAMEFFMEIKATYKKTSEITELDVIKEHRRPRLLVLDEIGKRSDTPWENALLFELLDKRYQDMTDTIVISNETEAEFLVGIGPSLASRMQETGGLIKCDWESFR